MSESLFSPERRAAAKQLYDDGTPGEWRVEPGTTHLEIKAPHQDERAIARVYCDIDGALIVTARNALPDAIADLNRLEAENTDLRNKVAGFEHVQDLWNKGMESTCDDRDVLKQEVRRLAAENARLDDERREAHVFLTGRFEMGWCMTHAPDAQAETELGQAAQTLLARAFRLEDAIRRHRNYRGDDRCWQDDEELYRALPEGYTPPTRGVAVEKANCDRFIECRHNPATEYVSPQREIERLEALLRAHGIDPQTGEPCEPRCKSSSP